MQEDRRTSLAANAVADKHVSPLPQMHARPPQLREGVLLERPAQLRKPARCNCRELAQLGTQMKPKFGLQLAITSKRRTSATKSTCKAKSRPKRNRMCEWEPQPPLKFRNPQKNPGVSQAAYGKLLENTWLKNLQTYKLQIQQKTNAWHDEHA